MVTVNLMKTASAVRTLNLSRVPCVGEVIWPDVSDGPGYIVVGVMHFIAPESGHTVDAELQVREIARDEPLPWQRDESLERAAHHSIIEDIVNGGPYFDLEGDCIFCEEHRRSPEGHLKQCVWRRAVEITPP